MGEPIVVRMPKLSDTMEEGVVVSWKKNAGDKIMRGDIIAEVETDKAVMDVEVFREGFLSGPIASIGDTIRVGDPIACIVEDATEVKEEALPLKEEIMEEKPGEKEKETVEGKEVTPAFNPVNKIATPYARKLAASLGVNLDAAMGTGPQGEITAEDVLKIKPVKRPDEIEAEKPVYLMPEIQVAGHGRHMSVMEKAVSRSMTASLTMPLFRVTVSMHPENLISLAKENGVSFTVMFAKAMASAIRKHPKMNWAYQPVEKIVERTNVDIGIAVSAGDGGLVVPILRNCEARPVDELNRQWKELVERARHRKITPGEYTNPTIMLSNMGMLGVDHFDAIPTPGMAAVLALASAGANGMPVTATADHRVVNGTDVALYLQTLKKYIEDPKGEGKNFL